MGKPSEQKLEDSDDTSTLTGEESHSKPSDPALEEQLLKKLTDVQQELSEDVVKCSKCHSSDINKLYITGHDVLHCICNICENEWVE